MASVTEIDSIKDEDLILPPDVSAASFREAIKAIAAAIGQHNVHVHGLETMKPDEEGEYYNLPKEHDLFYVLEKDTFLASAVVAPGSTEETQEIVKIANKYLTPLWPVSMGRNLGEDEARPLSCCRVPDTFHQGMVALLLVFGGASYLILGSA